MNLATSAFGTTLTVGASAFGWSLVEARLYTRRWVTVPASAPDAPPLRILHLSDLHLLPSQHRKKAFVRSCLVTGPDVLVITGDILGHREVIDEAICLLGPLAERRVALFSLGSNDFFAPVAKNPLRYLNRSAVHTSEKRLDTARLVAGLERHGWICIENTRRCVDTPAGVIDVLGLGDAHVDHDRSDAWPNMGLPDAILRLGVTHAPYLRVLDVFSDHGVDLALAGHTHGGQVRIPGVGALVDNCDLPLRQARGLSAHTKSMWLHVSAGLGTNLYTPIRFACRPEVTVIDVVARRVAAG